MASKVGYAHAMAAVPHESSVLARRVNRTLYYRTYLDSTVNRPRDPGVGFRREGSRLQSYLRPLGWDPGNGPGPTWKSHGGPIAEATSRVSRIIGLAPRRSGSCCAMYSSSRCSSVGGLQAPPTRGLREGPRHLLRSDHTAGDVDVRFLGRRNQRHRGVHGLLRHLRRRRVPREHADLSLNPTTETRRSASRRSGLARATVSAGVFCEADQRI